MELFIDVQKDVKEKLVNAAAAIFIFRHWIRRASTYLKKLNVMSSGTLLPSLSFRENYKAVCATTHSELRMHDCAL